MTVMLAKTYAALKAAGVPDAQAEAAVEELGNLNDQVGGLGQAMQEMHADIKAELQKGPVQIVALQSNEKMSLVMLAVLSQSP